jgi:hypothetical protein
MAEKPNDHLRPLLETWRELNRDRDGEPSDLLKQRRALGEDLRKFAQKPHIRELRETLRRMQESGVAEKMMGRMRPVSPSRPGDSVGLRKRKSNAGRKPSLTLEERAEGIRILRSQPRLSVNAACWELQKAGIKAHPSSLYRLIIKPAYASRS